MMSICLVMIVKNESKAIKRCLDSVKDQVDYWVISDTGSTDDTEKIVKETLKGIKGQYLHHKWENFGANRTKVFEAARGKTDWCLLLDADFEVKGNFDNLDVQTADALLVRFEGDLSWRLPLITNNNMNFFYEGFVHEYLACLEPFRRENYDGITIVHHGEDSPDSETRIERNLELLLGQKESARKCFYLAETYRQKGDVDNALHWYHQRISWGDWPEEVFYSMWRIGELRKDVPMLLEAWQHSPHRAEPLHTLQWLFRETEKWDLAILFGKEAEGILQPEGLFVHGQVYQYLVLFELSISYARKGWFDTAEYYNEAVLERNPPASIVEQIEFNRGTYPKE